MGVRSGFLMSPFFSLKENAFNATFEMFVHGTYRPAPVWWVFTSSPRLPGIFGERSAITAIPSIPSCSIPIGLIFVSPKLNQQLHHRQMATHGSHMDRRSTTLVHLVLICSHLQQITHHLLVVEMKMVWGSPPNQRWFWPTNLSEHEKMHQKWTMSIQVSRCPRSAAMCRGVAPKSPNTFWSSPDSTRKRTTSTWRQGRNQKGFWPPSSRCEARNYSTLNILLTNAPRGCKTITTSATHPQGPESPTCNLWKWNQICGSMETLFDVLSTSSPNASQQKEQSVFPSPPPSNLPHHSGQPYARQQHRVSQHVPS